MEQKLKQTISKDMLIGEFIQEHPELVENLLAEGVHCVGCGAAHYESLEQGLAVHGKTAEQIEKFIESLNIANDKIQERNQFTNKGKKIEAPFLLSENVVKKIKELQSEQKNKKGLRVSVLPGGCSGMSYFFDWEETKKENDIVITSKGVEVYVDKDSLEFIRGATLDYVSSLNGGGFKINNPNAKNSCGCGQSFS